MSGNVTAGDSRVRQDRVVSGAPTTLIASLTAREREVAQLLRRGLARKEIAAHLGISANTAHQHERAIFQKLGCNRRTQVVARLLEGRAALASYLFAFCSLGGFEIIPLI